MIVRENLITGGAELKQINLIFESELHLEEKIKIENFNQKNLLIFVFSDESVEKIKKILASIRKLLPEALVAGASSAGTIKNGCSVEGSTLIVFCQFENIQPKGILLPESEFEPSKMAKEIKNKVCSDETKLLFLFKDGLESDSPLLLDEIAEIMPDLPLAGGKAGSNNYFAENTYVFLNDEVLNKGALAVTLNGPFLRVSQQYRLNWKKIGKKMKVTSAEGNTLKTVEGIPTMELYEKYMGKEFTENLPESAGLEFPFIIEREGMTIARSLVNKFPDGSVLFHGDIRAGEEVQFGYGHVPLIIEEVEKECIQASEFQPEGILIFSCVARKNLLEKSVNYELEPFAGIAPSAGFFTFGEFYHQNKRNHLLNITMTMVLLSEEPEKEDFNKKHICELKIHNPDRRLSITKTLINLVDQVSTELEKTNKELQHLSNTDSLTELYNHRYFLETLEHEINRANRYKKKLSIAILDLDDLKFVNDTFGHSTGDRVLRDVAGRIKSSCRETDIVSRYGGDEIVIIFTETGLKEAVEVTERIRCNVSQMTFPEKSINITLSSGVVELDSEDNIQIMKKADERLYKAKKIGKNTTICNI